MRPIFSVILGLVVGLLWLISATLIAAPANVVQMIVPSSLNLSRTAIQMIGLAMFLISMLLVMVWALAGSDGSEKEAVVVPAK